MGRTGVEVDVLFVLWAVRVLRLKGRAVKIDPRYAHREEELRARLQRDGDPLEIQDFSSLESTGHVRLHGCRLAAMTFDVAPEDLLPEADGILDPGEFLRSIAAGADHCQWLLSRSGQVCLKQTSAFLFPARRSKDAGFERDTEVSRERGMHDFGSRGECATLPRSERAGAVAHLTVAAGIDRLAHLIEEPLFLLLERLGAAGIVRRRRFGEPGSIFAEPGAIGAPGLLIDDLDAASGAGHPSAQRETVQLIAGSLEVARCPSRAPPACAPLHARSRPSTARLFAEGIANRPRHGWSGMPAARRHHFVETREAQAFGKMA